MVFRSCQFNHRQEALSFLALSSLFLVRLSDLALASGASRRICPCRYATAIEPFDQSFSIDLEPRWLSLRRVHRVSSEEAFINLTANEVDRDHARLRGKKTIVLFHKYSI